MITYFHMVSFSDYFSQLKLINSVLRETILNSIDTGDTDSLDRALLLSDLLIQESEKVLGEFCHDVDQLRDEDIRANLETVSKNSPHLLKLIGVEPNL
jgi:hypothetical protein